MLFRFILTLLFLFVPSADTKPFESEPWLPIREKSLEVVPGSVLDFSTVFSGEAAGTNRPGSSTWAMGTTGDLPSRRLLCASLVPSGPNGGMPDKATADRWVEQLQRTGYNLVRLHFIDAILMTGRQADFDYDPVAFDRLHYLMAKLKAAGIHWIVDGLTSGNGAYGNVQPHRWVNRYSLHERLYYDPTALEHWKRVVTSIWGRVNPYTGLAPIHDPALLGIILVNEGSLAFRSTLNGHYPAEMGKPFADWLKARAANSATKKQSAGVEGGGESLTASKGVPSEIRGNDARSRDFAIFIAERERALFREMEAHLRERGFKGLVTSYNNWDFYHAHAVRGALDWIDMHAYQSLPSHFAEVGSLMKQTSIFDDAGRYGRSLMNARHWDKPFTVTEYGQPFWNQWRHESAAWLPALAAFQGWNAICQFAELPVLLEYADRGPPRLRALVPFGVGADPVARGAERLAALLYRRGDVTPSRLRVKLVLSPTRLFTEGKAWRQVPEKLSRLCLVAGCGLVVDDDPVRPLGNSEIVFDLNDEADGYLGKVADVALKQGLLLGRDPVARMRAAGMLSTDNRTELAEGVFESDTGQLLLDTKRRRMVVNTPRSVAFTLRSGSDSAGAVALADLSGPATVAVGAVDDQVIRNSRRMLVWVLTDALNTGMEFQDEGRTTLKRLGAFPVRIRGVSGRLTIRHVDPASLKVWAVDQAGRRVAPIAVSVFKGTLSFAIDNFVPDYGPVTYFEVAAR